MGWMKAKSVSCILGLLGVASVPPLIFRSEQASWASPGPSHSDFLKGLMLQVKQAADAKRQGRGAASLGAQPPPAVGVPAQALNTAESTTQAWPGVRAARLDDAADHAARAQPEGLGTAEGQQPPEAPRLPLWQRSDRLHGPRCPTRAKAPKRWNRVRREDWKLMKAFGDASAVEDCQVQGGALVFRLMLKRARKLDGRAFELPFPDYVVADEAGGWRERRSTLQLFALGLRGRGGPQPLGPAHASHSYISSKGNGAYSHWRQPITAGPNGSSNIRFSTPGNVPLDKLKGLLAVVFPMAPHMGWIEFTRAQPKKHQEIFRELFLQTCPTVAVEPHVVERASQVRNGTWYLWRVGGNHEFELPLKPGELYEKQLPHQIASFYGEFERSGGMLFPPAASYVYYQNKVGLAELFQQAGVKTPRTWVFRNADEALRAKPEITLPVVVKDPYGFSSHGIQQAVTWPEYTAAIRRYFADALPGVEALVQRKVVALREARVTYVDGRPFHGYWRIRRSLESASAASNLGGYQDFSFPLADIAPFIARFANLTGVPVGGVDLIWQEAEPDIKTEPYALEVSPTSDINPPAPASWKKTYAEFKKTSGYRAAYLGVRRRWSEQMVLAIIDRHRRARRHLFVDIDNVVSLSAPRVRRWKGSKQAYAREEVLTDEAVRDAVDALRELGQSYVLRFLTARGQYEDAFNVTQSWLDAKGFEYDELIVVQDARSKVAHLTRESLLVDDFTVGHEDEVPRPNNKFMAELREAGLPFVVFPFGGHWADIMPLLRREASAPAVA